MLRDLARPRLLDPDRLPVVRVVVDPSPKAASRSNACASCSDWSVHMAQYTYTVVLHPDAELGGYGVEVPALPRCFAQGATREEALERVQEAISAHIAGLRADGEPVPEETEQPELARVEVAA